MCAHRVVVLALLAACGDDGSAVRIDAPGSGSADAAVDAHIIANCTFQEMADPTNDVSPSAEATNITFSSTISLCGSINTGHFDSAQELVDQDIFKLTFSADTDIVIHFTGDAANLDEFSVQVAQSSSVAGYGTWVNDHGALAAHVTAGVWYVAVGGFNPTDATASFDYHVTIATDTPATRCAHKTTGGYPEANDGGSSNGNDMLLFDESADPQKSLTASATDAPEPSGVTTAPATQYRLTGTAANVNPSDSYMDRDTYEFTTGASTNELSIRLNWPSTAVDFDYFVVPAASARSIVAGLRSRNAEDEFQTFSVKPNTTYWLWVGAYDASTLPANYDATICGESFTP